MSLDNMDSVGASVNWGTLMSQTNWLVNDNQAEMMEQCLEMHCSAFSENQLLFHLTTPMYISFIHILAPPESSRGYVFDAFFHEFFRIASLCFPSIASFPYRFVVCPALNPILLLWIVEIVPRVNIISNKFNSFKIAAEALTRLKVQLCVSEKLCESCDAIEEAFNIFWVSVNCNVKNPQLAHYIKLEVDSSKELDTKFPCVMICGLKVFGS